MGTGAHDYHHALIVHSRVNLTANHGHQVAPLIHEKISDMESYETKNLLLNDRSLVYTNSRQLPGNEHCLSMNAYDSRYPTVNLELNTERCAGRVSDLFEIQPVRCGEGVIYPVSSKATSGVSQNTEQINVSETSRTENMYHRTHESVTVPLGVAVMPMSSYVHARTENDITRSLAYLPAHDQFIPFHGGATQKVVPAIWGTTNQVAPFYGGATQKVIPAI